MFKKLIGNKQFALELLLILVLLPILFTFSGSTTFTKLLSSNAYGPIVVNVEGNSIETKSLPISHNRSDGESVSRDPAELQKRGYP